MVPDDLGLVFATSPYGEGFQIVFRTDVECSFHLRVTRVDFDDCDAVAQGLDRRPKTLIRWLAGGVSLRPSHPESRPCLFPACARKSLTVKFDDCRTPTRFRLATASSLAGCLNLAFSPPCGAGLVSTGLALFLRAEPTSSGSLARISREAGYFFRSTQRLHLGFGPKSYAGLFRWKRILRPARGRTASFLLSWTDSFVEAIGGSDKRHSAGVSFSTVHTLLPGQGAAYSDHLPRAALAVAILQLRRRPSLKRCYMIFASDGHRPPMSTRSLTKCPAFSCKVSCNTDAQLAKIETTGWALR